MQVRKSNSFKLTPPANWPEDRQIELLRNTRNGCVGRFVLSENARVRVWRLDLDPGERLGFHCHVLDYYRVALTSGRALSHDHLGNEQEFSFATGEVRHVQFQKGDFVLHDMKNIGEAPFSMMICEHLRSENAPLPIPDHIRVKPRHLDDIQWTSSESAAVT
jgi:hypothetical protein